MHDYQVYIALEQKNTNGIVAEVNSLYQIVNDCHIRFTWIANKRINIIRTIFFMFRCEKQLKKRNITFHNCIELRCKQQPGAFCIWILGIFGIDLHMHVASYASNKTQIDKLISKLRHHNVEYCYFCDDYSADEYISWIKSKSQQMVQPYIDITKMYYAQEMLQCQFSSRLGKTVYFDELANAYFCPYYTHNSKLNRPSECEAFNQLFDTDDFVSAIKERLNKRNECISGCRSFNSCKGGCAQGKSCVKADYYRCIEAAQKEDLYNVTVNDSDCILNEELLIMVKKLGERI